jgi:hypothetical protein
MHYSGIATLVWSQEFGNHENWLSFHTRRFSPAQQQPVSELVGAVVIECCMP